MNTWHDIIGGGPRRTIVNKGTQPCSIGFQDEQGRLYVLARLAPGATTSFAGDVLGWTDEGAADLLIYEDS